MPRLKAYAETWPLREVFTISRGSRTETPVVVCEIEQDGVRGWGEGQPNPRYDETQESALAEIEAVRACLESGALDRIGLQSAMKAGSARNAIDCAFWDFEAKRPGNAFGSLRDYPNRSP